MSESAKAMVAAGATFLQAQSSKAMFIAMIAVSFVVSIYLVIVSITALVAAGNVRTEGLGAAGVCSCVDGLSNAALKTDSNWIGGIGIVLSLAGIGASSGASWYMSKSASVKAV
jgi:hypothetical protein